MCFFSQGYISESGSWSCSIIFPKIHHALGAIEILIVSDLQFGNPTEKISKPQSSAGFGFWSPRPAPARPGRPGISCTEVQGWGGQVGNSLSHHGFQYPNGLTWIHWGPVDIIDIMDTAELMPLTSQVREWAFEHPRPRREDCCRLKLENGWKWSVPEMWILAIHWHPRWSICHVLKPRS